MTGTRNLLLWAVVVTLAFVIKYWSFIGITHVFHAFTFAGSQESFLNMMPLGGVFKHLPRDPPGKF